MSLEQARSRGECIPRNCSRPQALRYSERVRYVEQLRRFHAAFSPQQILTLIYDDFRDDNEAVARRVLRFLELDDTQPLRVAEANPTVAVRSVRMYSLKHTLRTAEGPAARAVGTAARALATRRVRTLLGRAMYGPTPQPDEQLMLELRRRFEPEVIALSEYLGRDLVGLWGYDSLG